MTPADHETHPNLEILTLFYDGEGDARMLRDIEEHLGACETCRAQLARLKQLSAELAETELTAPVDLRERVTDVDHRDAPVAPRAA